MLDVLQRCFPTQYESWKPKLQEMVPSLGIKLSDDTALFSQVWDWTSKVLQLDTSKVEDASVAV